MALPAHLNTREHDKFVEIGGNTAVRISDAGSLVKEAHDYIGVTYPNSTTETYTFKSGGSGGTTVATVTVVYTDSTKASLSSVTKT